MSQTCKDLMHRLTVVGLLSAIFFFQKRAETFSQKRATFDLNSFQINYVNQ